MRTYNLSPFFCKFAAITLFLLSVSCSYMIPEEVEPEQKLFAPGTIRANDIEYIAACEVGKREADGLNYGSNNVIERNGLYYVSIVSRPHLASAQRTVVINDRGEVVDYKKGWKPYSSTTATKQEAMPLKLKAE